MSLAVGFALVAAACGNGQNDAAPAPGRQAGEPVELEWVAALERIPDTPETRAGVLMSILAEDDLDRTHPGPPLVRAADEELQVELGIGIADVDVLVAAGELSGQTRVVLTGSFDVDRIDSVVRSEPAFSDLLRTDTHAGVEYYAWGTDARPDMARRTAVRHLGQGHRLAVRSPNELWWTLDDAAMHSMIEASSGTVPSLAAFSSIAGVADALQAVEARFALMRVPGRLHTPSIDEQIDRVVMGVTEADRRAEIAADLRQLGPHGLAQLRPYEAFGVAIRRGDAELLVVLAHASPELAEDNVRRLRFVLGVLEARGLHQAEQSGYRAVLREVEITAHGTVLTARLAPTSETPDTRRLFRLLELAFTGDDNLLWSEPH